MKFDPADNKANDNDNNNNAHPMKGAKASAAVIELTISNMSLPVTTDIDRFEFATSAGAGTRRPKLISRRRPGSLGWVLLISVIGLQVTTATTTNTNTAIDRTTPNKARANETRAIDTNATVGTNENNLTRSTSAAAAAITQEHDSSQFLKTIDSMKRFQVSFEDNKQQQQQQQHNVRKRKHDQQQQQLDYYNRKLAKGKGQSIRNKELLPFTSLSFGGGGGGSLPASGVKSVASGAGEHLYYHRQRRLQHQRPPRASEHYLSGYAASGLTSSAVAAPAAAAGASLLNSPTANMRMKIMLNPTFGAGLPLQPNQKCNFEIYPSGCFDENGSLCDHTTGRCACRPGYTIRINGGIYCLRPATIGEACYTTDQCVHRVPESGCFNYREEYREANPSAFFGPSQSQWPMGECRCRVGHRYDEVSNSCVRSTIGSWCSNVWDCELAKESTTAGNHSFATTPANGHRGHSGHSAASFAQARTNKLLNIVCEHNTCNCAKFFHYNQTSDKCQYAETFGRSCRYEGGGDDLDDDRESTAKKSRKTKRTLAFDNELSGRSSSHRRYGVASPSRVHRSLQLEEEVDEFGNRWVKCNLPTTCTRNSTCTCAEGFEHEPNQTPQCQPLNKASHYYGGSGRAILKDHGVLYENLEGESNLANFYEYVLYILVPGLLIIILIRPWCRRLAEWHSHVYRFEGDNEFYVGSAPTSTRPVVAEMNVINANSGEKNGTAFVPADMIAPFPYGGTHLGCHNAYIFEPADTCFGSFGPGTSCTNAAAAAAANNVAGSNNAAAIALVKEKLKTIEESNSEENLLDSSAVAAAATATSGSPGTTCLATGCTCQPPNMYTPSIECTDHGTKDEAKDDSHDGDADEDDGHSTVTMTTVVIEKAPADLESIHSETKC